MKTGLSLFCHSKNLHFHFLGKMQLKLCFLLFFSLIMITVNCQEHETDDGTSHDLQAQTEHDFEPDQFMSGQAETRRRHSRRMRCKKYNNKGECVWKNDYTTRMFSVTSSVDEQVQFCDQLRGWASPIQRNKCFAHSNSFSFVDFWPSVITTDEKYFNDSSCIYYKNSAWIPLPYFRYVLFCLLKSARINSWWLRARGTRSYR